MLQVVLAVERAHSVQRLFNTLILPILVLVIFCVRKLRLVLEMGII